MAKKKSFLSGGIVKKLILALGAIGGAGMIGHFTGINNGLVAPVFAYLIGGLPVALIALAIPMLTGGGGLNLSSLMGGGRAIPANPNVSTAGTVYT